MLVSNATFITIVIAIAVMSISMMTLVTKQLGDRVTDLGNRLGAFETRVDRRFDAMEGALTDVAARLTRLEHDLGTG